jgi:hypothetical protein
MTRGSGRIALLVLGVLGLLAVGCAPAPPSQPATGDPPSEPVTPAELASVPADTVVDWTGPGGHPFEVTRRLPGDPTHLHRVIGTETYPLALRPGEGTLLQYPCASCHEGVTITGARDPDAHGNIDPVHPSRLGQDCATCHVAESVELLRLATGEAVSLDHGYRLCAQCHYQQAEGWAAGSHGKRLYGWAGRRIVMNCADCHDPHAPAAPQRVPFPGPILPQTPGVVR